MYISWIVSVDKFKEICWMNDFLKLTWDPYELCRRLCAATSDSAEAKSFGGRNHHLHTIFSLFPEARVSPHWPGFFLLCKNLYFYGEACFKLYFEVTIWLMRTFIVFSILAFRYWISDRWESPIFLFRGTQTHNQTAEENEAVVLYKLIPYK